MGQIFSNLLRCLLFQEARNNETSRDEDYQPIINYQKFSNNVFLDDKQSRDDDNQEIFYDFVDEKQLKSHFINIFDQIHPSLIRSETVENHHQYNFSNQGSTTINEDDSKINSSDDEQVIEEEEVQEEIAKKKTRKRRRSRRKKKNITSTKIPPVIVSVRKIGDYTSLQRILLVGEGDFSFSASLAVAFGSSAFNIIATSLDRQDFLMKNYGMFMSNKEKLESRGSWVFHGVNARKMMKDPLLGSLLFDRIIFNFPHTGKFDKSDAEIRTNQKLVRGFLRNAKKMIGEAGEIHITSKSTSFYETWNIPKLGSEQGLFLIQEEKFNRGKYPGYHTKFGFGGDKDFDCNPSKTYKFGLSPN